MNTINYKLNKQKNINTKLNLKSSLIVAVKETNTGNVYKETLNKNLENGEYKITPKLNIPILQKKTLVKGSVNKLLKGDKLHFVQLDRKTKTYNPVDIVLINNNNLNVRLLNNSKWSFTISFSSFIENKTIEPIKNLDGSNFSFRGSKEELEDVIANYISEKFNWLPEVETLILTTPIKFIDVNDITSDFNFYSERGYNEYYIEKRNKKYAELKNIFNEVIEPVENPPEKNCVIYFFEMMHKKRQKKVYSLILKELKELINNKGTIYLTDLKQILLNKEITIFIYSVNGLEFSKKSDSYTVSKSENIVLYIEDNHLYKITSKKHINHLTKKVNTNYDNAILKVNKDLGKDILLNCPIISLDIKAYETQFLLLDDKNNNLISNSETSLISKKFIEALGYDKKFLSSSPQNFINRIKDKYNINHFSLFPFKVVSNVLLYKNNNIKQDKHDILLNIDKNKCYSNALNDCPFIPLFNIMTNTKREYIENEKIIDQYIYFIQVNEPNEIYFNNGFWFGCFINKYGGLRHIKIKYVFECDILKDKDNNIFNPYGVLVNDLYNLAETEEETKFLKNSINCYIGQMLMSEPRTIITKKNYKNSTGNDLKLYLNNNDFDKYNKNNYDIDTGEEREKINFDNATYEEVLKIWTLRSNYGYKICNVNDDIYTHWETVEKINKNMGNDNKPLHILIENIAQGYILDMMNKIKTFDNKPLNKDDIIEINTDSIYITNSHKYNLDIIKNCPNDWKEWKLEKGYKEKQLVKKEHFKNDDDIINEAYFYETNNNKYEFNLEYAGGGKSYRIKKIIDQELKKNKNYSYIILSTQHDHLTEYRKNGYKTNTIAHYVYNNLDITEKNIYIDECGLVSLSDNIFLMRHSNKNFYFYGDDKQLEPVKSKLLNNDFIKQIANVYNTNWTNKRNTFSKEFYDKLINEKNIDNIIKTVNMFNAPINKAEIIIAFYNETVEKYNKMMLEKYNKKFDNDDISLNMPVINTENKLSLKNISTNAEELIYNKHSFTIENKINDETYIINDTINKFYISKRSLLKYFKLGYCITLYASQGKTFKYFHYVNEDIKALIKKGALYTLISRLKFDDEEEYKIKILNMNIEEDNNYVLNVMNDININS